MMHNISVQSRADYYFHYMKNALETFNIKEPSDLIGWFRCMVSDDSIICR